MLTGIDRCVDDGFARFRGMKIGLLSQIACCDRKLTPTVSRFGAARSVRLGALFAPEHGFYGADQDQVRIPNALYQARTKIYSLYGGRRAPSTAALKGLDAIVIDLHDIGTRYYTFAWSAMLMIKEAAPAAKPVFILDRPNPLNGVTVQGPLIEPGFESFVGLFSVPVRHAMTIAELCTMLNATHAINADITVVRLRGWRRQDQFDDRRPWTVPSPNMPRFTTALVYPGMCLLEGTNVSEGRGTTTPFEMFGAPWIEPSALARKMEKRDLPGCAFRPVRFTPVFHKHRGRLCGGLQLYVRQRAVFDPLLTGLEIIRAIRNLYPRSFRWRQPPYEFERKKMPFDILVGNSWIREGIERGLDAAALRRQWHADLARFKSRRRKYLLYA